MRKFKRFFSFIWPMILVVAISLGVFLPISFAVHGQRGRKAALKGSEAEQIVYAESDTGAATAAKDYKGGAIFLEPESIYNMSGGTISGHENTYGGAIYISDKATFTMSGGTISNNKATYGGAIYVAAGGKCVLKGGTITQNSANVAPAIYVEEGGTLQISGNAIIKGNRYYANDIGLKVSEDRKIMGGQYKQNNSAYGEPSTVALHTATLGSYPQHVATESVAQALEASYESKSPVGEFNASRDKCPVYQHTDGNLYARVYVSPYRRDHEEGWVGGGVYENGEDPKQGYNWFKVEPISWFVLNYEAWQAGAEPIELWSEFILSAMMFNSTQEQGNAWETSEIRAWLNGTFFEEAFNAEEQSAICYTQIKNNITGDYDNAASDGTGPDTIDRVWLKSFYELNSGIFATDPDITIPQASPARLCHGTDFAVAQDLVCNITKEDYQIAGYQKVGMYWTRSAGMADGAVCYEDGNGYLALVSFYSYGVRPVIRVDTRM